MGVHSERDRLFSLPTVLAAWALFGLAHTLARVFNPSPLSDVDGLGMLAAQSLAMAYQAGQPPLFDWAVWAVQQVTGPTAFSVYLTKYAFITAAGGFIYCGAFVASGERRLAAMASLSLMLLYNVGAAIHDQSTHSCALIASLAATFYFFAMLATRAAWRDYVGLGIAMAAGTLSKYGYPIMPLSFAVAFIYSPSLRSRILSWRFAVALLIASALVLPFASWVAMHQADLSAKIHQSLITLKGASYLERVKSGLWRLFESVLLYSLPIMPILWTLYPSLLTRGASLSGARAGRFADVVGLALALGLLTAIALVLISTTDKLHPRYVHVLALLLPVYAVLHLHSDEIAGRRWAAFLAITAATQLVFVAQRSLAPIFPAPPFCTSCDFLQPIDKLADELAVHGRSRATIWIEHDLSLGGNLRAYLPLAQVRTRHLAAKALPGRHDGEPCIMIVAAPNDPTRQNRASLPPAPAGAVYPNPPEILTMPWKSNISNSNRTTSWIVQALRDDDPRCSAERDW